MRTKFLRLFAILILSYSCANAQNVHGNVDTEDGQKPNASKGSGGSQITNVDLFTGTGSMNIPIHGFSVDGLNAGVSLSYMAKGIRVDELSSSVGLGWNLNAGGSIVREVYGIEDEVTLPAFFKFGAVTYPTPDPSTYDWLEGVLVPGANNTPPPYDVNTDDKEYDLFHVSLLGRSFTFGIKYVPGSSTQLVTYCQPNNQVKIDVISEDWNTSLTQVLSSTMNVIPNNAGSTPYNGVIKFKITDEEGNKYYFERGDYEYKEYDVDENLFNDNKGTYYATQKWNLTKVETYTGKEIDFIYEQKYIERLDNITETLYQNKQEQLDLGNLTVEYDPLEIEEHMWKGVKSHIKEIHYPNGTKVYFDIAHSSTSSNTSRVDCPGDYILNDIRVEKEDNVNVKNTLTFQLDHAYFNTPKYGFGDNELDYDTDVSQVTSVITFPNVDARDEHQQKGMRLKLKGITRVGFDSYTTEDYYKFEYNHIALPYRFSPHKDYYGFYNGKSPVPYIRDNFFYGAAPQFPQYDTFYLSIPYHTDPGGTYSTGYSIYNTNWGLDRSYDLNYAQASVLHTIINSYGGKEQITYQDYTLSNPSCPYNYRSESQCSNNNPIGCVLDPDIEGTTVNDGLCVKEITFFNGFHLSHSYKVEYTLSDGVRFFQGGYTWYKESNGDQVRTNRFVDPQDLYNGSNHGFKTVRVKRKGYFVNNILSDKQYEYSGLMYYDASYSYNSNMRSHIDKVTDMAYHTMGADFAKHKVGLLLNEKEYDKNGNVVTSKDYTYTEVYDPSPYAYNHYIQSLRYFPSSCYPTPASFQYTLIDDKRMLLTQETFTRHVNVLNSGAGQMSTVFDYDYDDYDNISTIAWTDSKGVNFYKKRKYNYDFPNTIPIIGSLNNADRQHLLTNEVWKVDGTDSSLLDLKITSPTGDPNTTINFTGFFTLFNNEPIAKNIAEPMLSSGSNPQAIKVDKAFDYSNNNDFGDHILMRKEFTLLSANGDLLEKRLNDQDLYISALYDGHSRKVANVKNARWQDIAFTSFEGQSGRWTFNNNNITHSPSAAMTGEHELALTSNGIESPTLNEKDYIVALWVKSVSIPTAELYNAGGTSSINLTEQNEVGDWKLYTARISPDSGDILKIYNAALDPMYIDEIRLHPAEASMKTYTYLPMCGIASESNSMNYIHYYDYDVFGRLTHTRNIRKEIISKLEQVAQGNDN